MPDYTNRPDSGNHEPPGDNNSNNNSAGGGGTAVITPDQRRELSSWLAAQGRQALLPVLELVRRESAGLAVDELIDAMGKAAVEAVLELSAAEVAGPKAQGRRDADVAARPVVHHGTQDGVVELSQRKLRVRRPRLRRRGGGAGAEVEVPAYAALRANAALGRRVLEILLLGVSTRRYVRVLPDMADSLGVSKSAVSRHVIEEGERVLKELAERRFDDKDILIVYVDGMRFAGHHVLAAVGVDADGHKHVLGMTQGASENATTVTALLEGLVERGVRPEPGRRRLFVIDGAKALRSAIDRVYGQDNPVQRCRNHKLRNVLDHLPEDQQDQARAALRAAWKLPAKAGQSRLEQLAKWYEKDQPGAAASIREGLAEMFTVGALGLPKTLCRCLCTTNLIDSGHSAIRRATGRVTYWRDGSMALRWAAAAAAAAEKRFKRIMGCHQLWMLKAHLDGGADVAERTKTGIA